MTVRTIYRVLFAAFALLVQTAAVIYAVDWARGTNHHAGTVFAAGICCAVVLWFIDPSVRGVFIRSRYLRGR